VCVCVCARARALKMQTIIVKPIGMYTNHLVLRPEYATGISVSLRHTVLFLPFHSEYFAVARRMCSLTIKFICKLSIQIVPFNDRLITCFDSKHYLRTVTFCRRYVTKQSIHACHRVLYFDNSVPEHKSKDIILQMCDLRKIRRYRSFIIESKPVVSFSPIMLLDYTRQRIVLITSQTATALSESKPNVPQKTPDPLRCPVVDSCLSLMVPTV